jgi:hypothetical protein
MGVRDLARRSSAVSRLKTQTAEKRHRRRQREKLRVLAPLWDRLPMTIEFTSKVAAIIAERRQSAGGRQTTLGNIAAHSIVSEPERATSGVESQ